MGMENSRRSFEILREISLKKPRLSDESDRDMNQSSRTFQQRPPPTCPGSLSSRLRAGEREDPNRVSFQQQQHQELVDQYKTALLELTFNSKPIITNLTIIAGENLHFAKAISATVCANILEVSTDRKLPALYLLDSIVKNIGKDYIGYFAARLPEVFCKAYRQVDSSTRQSMQHLFGTWKGIFSPEPLQVIERELGFNATVNGASSSATSSKSDFQSPRQSHSIHVNPKYLEARQQHFQQSTMNNQICASKETGEEPVNNKDSAAAYGDSDDGHGAGISRSSGLVLQRPGHDDPIQEHNKKRYRGGEGMAAVPAQSNGLAVKNRPPNYSHVGSVHADVLARTDKIRESKSGVAALKNWKNSEEEEYTWNGPGMADGTRQSLVMKENWISGDSGNLEFDKSLGKQLNMRRTDYNIEWEASADSLSSHRGHSFPPHQSLTSGSKNDARFRVQSVQSGTKSRSFPKENDSPDGTSTYLLPKTSKPHTWTSSYGTPPHLDRANVIGPEASGHHLPHPTHKAQLSFFHKSPSSLPFPSPLPVTSDRTPSDGRKWYQPGISGQKLPTHDVTLPPPPPSALPFSSRRPHIRDADGSPKPDHTWNQSFHRQIQVEIDSNPVQQEDVQLQRTERLRSENFHDPSKSHFHLKNQVSDSPEVQPGGADVPKLPLETASRSYSDNLKPPVAKFGNLTDSVMKNRVLSNSSVTNRLQNMGFQETGSVSRKQAAVQPSLLSARRPIAQFSSSQTMPSEVRFPSHESVSNSSASSDHSRGKRKKQSSFLSDPASPSSPEETTSGKNSVADSKSASPISSLLSKLMANGLISASKPDASGVPPLEQKLGESSEIAENRSRPSHATKNPVQSSTSDSDGVRTPAFIEPVGEGSKNLIGVEFRPKVLRELHPSVVDDLFDDLPHTCFVCSRRMRFGEQLSRHMEWHELKDGTPDGVKGPSRQWYVDSSDWMKSRNSPEFEPCVVEAPVGGGDDLQMVPADESQCVCIFCGEIFKDFYSFERDEWMFKDAVRMEIPSEYHERLGDGEGCDGPIVHTHCVSDAIFELESRMGMLES